MPHYVGLDASKATTNICVMDAKGVIVREGKVETTPQAINGFLRGDRRRYARVGMESWTLAPWLYEGLARARLPIICVEPYQTSKVLKAMRANKTDRNDARGIAEIMRAGIYKAVHIKSAESRDLGALLAVRKFLRRKALDADNMIRATLLGYGLKLGKRAAKSFDPRVRKLIRSRPFLADLVEPLLSVRARALKEIGEFERRMEAAAANDPVCIRLMTAPGVGPLTALMFRTTVDEPGRFVHSRDVGPHLGLTSRVDSSGTLERMGRISKRGDKAMRAALFQAAKQQFRRNGRSSWLRTWSRKVAAQAGMMKALVAIARRLAVTLHKMWVTETDFRWEAEAV